MPFKRPAAAYRAAVKPYRAPLQRLLAPWVRSAARHLWRGLDTGPARLDELWEAEGLLEGWAGAAEAFLRRAAADRATVMPEGCWQRLARVRSALAKIEKETVTLLGIRLLEQPVPASRARAAWNEALSIRRDLLGLEGLLRYAPLPPPSHGICPAMEKLPSITLTLPPGMTRFSGPLDIEPATASEAQLRPAIHVAAAALHGAYMAAALAYGTGLEVECEAARTKSGDAMVAIHALALRAAELGVDWRTLAEGGVAHAGQSIATVCPQLNRVEAQAVTMALMDDVLREELGGVAPAGGTLGAVL